MTAVRDHIEFSNVSIVAAGLDLKGGATADAETNNAIMYKVAGDLYSAAATATIDLSGATLPSGGSLVIADGSKNIVTVTVDTSGTYTAYVGTSATTLASIVPYEDDYNGEAVVGYIVIENETGSDFTIGTTGLDTANVTDTYLD